MLLAILRRRYPDVRRPGHRPGRCRGARSPRSIAAGAAALADGRRCGDRRRRRSPACSASCSRSRRSSAAGGLVAYAARRSRCASRNCPLSSGSCPTSSADRRELARRDGAPPTDPTPGTRSSPRPTRAPISSRRRGPRSRPSTAGRRTGSSRTTAPDGPIGAQVLVRRPRPLPWASPTRRAARSPPTGRRGGRGLHGALADGLPATRRRGVVARPDRSRGRGGRPARRGRRPAPGAARRRLAPGPADPAERDPDHRPRAPTRTRSGATSARSGASTSTRPGPRGVTGSSMPTATGSPSSTRSTARPPTGPAS